MFECSKDCIKVKKSFSLFQNKFLLFLKANVFIQMFLLSYYLFLPILYYYFLLNCSFSAYILINIY